jgi:hypothetical protein
LAAKPPMDPLIEAIADFAPIFGRASERVMK